MSRRKQSYKMALDRSRFSIYKKCLKSFLYGVTNRSNLEFLALQVDQSKGFYPK